MLLRRGGRGDRSRRGQMLVTKRRGRWSGRGSLGLGKGRGREQGGRCQWRPECWMKKCRGRGGRMEQGSELSGGRGRRRCRCARVRFEDRIQSRWTQSEMMERGLWTQWCDVVAFLLDDLFLVLRPASTQRWNEKKEKKCGQSDHQHDAKCGDDGVGQDEMFECLLVDHRRATAAGWCAGQVDLFVFQESGEKSRR